MPGAARISPERPAENARRVTHDLVELGGFLVADLFAADHRNRLRRLHDRRVGLGACHRTAGDIALDRAARIFDEGGRGLRLRRGRAGCRGLRWAQAAPWHCRRSRAAAPFGGSHDHRR